MVTISIAGNGSWCKEEGWLWLRIICVDQHKNCEYAVNKAASTVGRSREGKLLFDRCLLRKNKWMKEIRVDLKSRSDEDIAFELWTNVSKSIDFLQFVTSWSVNVAQWTQSGVAGRWYEVKTSQQQRQNVLSEAIDEPKFYESTAELQSSSAYICLKVIGVKVLAVDRMDLNEAAANKKQSFQFIFPHVQMTKSRMLRVVRVGQIVHELRVDILHDLLSLTLYGCDSIGICQHVSTGTANATRNGMMKALVLLQLSCQYAKHCVDELHRHSSKLEDRKMKLIEKLNRAKHRQKKNYEHKVNLVRELEVSTIALDRVQSLLEKMDPNSFACLQNDHELETVK